MAARRRRPVLLGLAGQLPSASLLCQGWWFTHRGKKGIFRVLGAPHIPQHRCLGCTYVWQEGKYLFGEARNHPPTTQPQKVTSPSHCWGHLLAWP